MYSIVNTILKKKLSNNYLKGILMLNLYIFSQKISIQRGEETER